MVYLTTEQRVLVVKTFFETGSIPGVQEAFRRRFPDRDPPTKSTIWYNVRKYKINGTSFDRHKGKSGRNRTSTSDGNVEAVRALLENDPHVSARRNGSGLSKSSFNRITKNHLRWHPYQINIRHALREDDFLRRLQFSNWFIERCRDFRFLANLLISDEANFQTNGEVNTQDRVIARS